MRAPRGGLGGLPLQAPPQGGQRRAVAGPGLGVQRPVHHRGVAGVLGAGPRDAVVGLGQRLEAAVAVVEPVQERLVVAGPPTRFKISFLMFQNMTIKGVPIIHSLRRSQKKIKKHSFVTAGIWIYYSSHNLCLDYFVLGFLAGDP